MQRHELPLTSSTLTRPCRAGLTVSNPGCGSDIHQQRFLQQPGERGETAVNAIAVATGPSPRVEAFPVLKAMMERIMGESPYQSPTDIDKSL